MPLVTPVKLGFNDPDLDTMDDDDSMDAAPEGVLVSDLVRKYFQWVGTAKDGTLHSQTHPTYLALTYIGSRSCTAEERCCCAV